MARTATVINRDPAVNASHPDRHEFGPRATTAQRPPDRGPEHNHPVRLVSVIDLVSAEKVGPIPGGPYGRCWEGLFQGGCEPCHYSWSYLDGLCSDNYGGDAYAGPKR
jgi:hypothetical protein